MLRLALDFGTAKFRRSIMMSPANSEQGAGALPSSVLNRDFELYPFQELALRSVDAGRSVLVAAPTGAGKTVIAEYAIEKALRDGRRIIYTSPIKALSNQKYRDFQARYGAQIGIMTGDVTITPEAPVQIMTTEIFRNTIFEDVDRLRGVSYVIMDEIHYISEPERGTVWEESIIFAPPGIRFVGLSATISNLEEFCGWIQQVRGETVDLVRTDDRPVPLRHHLFVPEVGPIRVSELKKVLGEAKANRRRDRRGSRPADIIDHLIHENLLPALYFCFSRRECEARARASQRRRLLDSAGRDRILTDFDELCRRYQVHAHRGAAELRQLASRGILFHHAGMLPIYKEIVERLFTSGQVKLLFTTETFALGVNMPARAVVFSSLRKFDGVSFDYLPTLNYYQMAGRAGRQGLDVEGNVYSVINVDFDTQKDVKEVIFGRVAPLESRFNLSYSAVLNLYAALGKEIYSAVDRSFAAYQRGGSSAKDRAVLRSRLQILEKQGYLQGGKLTDKGKLASRINGYEIHATELLWSGCFEGLSAEDCAVLVAAIIYEPRRGELHQRMDVAGLNAARSRGKKRVREFRRSERSFGMDIGIKELDFGLASAVRAWARGCAFEELQNFTSSQEGDIVRHLRMTVQVLRQLGWAVRDDQELHERLNAALELLNRDEVDAERQLRLG